MEDLMADFPVSPTLLRVVRVFRIGRILRLIRVSCQPVTLRNGNQISCRVGARFDGAIKTQLDYQYYTQQKTVYYFWLLKLLVQSNISANCNLLHCTARMVIDQGCMCRLPRGSGSCCSPRSSPYRRCSTSARCWLSSLLSMQSSGWQSSATSSTREPSTTSSTSRPSGDPCSFSSGAEHQNTLIRHLNKWHDFTSNLLGHLRVRHSLFTYLHFYCLSRMRVSLPTFCFCPPRLTITMTRQGFLVSQ